jgi:hypothetical protein
MRIGLGVVLSACIVAVFSGCESHHTVVHERSVVMAPPGEVMVSQQPPAVRHEVIGVAPSTEHIWVAGYWTYVNAKWVWVPGHWERRPRVGAGYYPGHWDKTTKGWVWTPGRWD